MFLSITSQIDLIFYAILGIAVLFGFIRGLKKSIFNLIIMLIFYIVFFVTLNTMVNILWTMNLSFLGSTFSNLDASLAGFQSFENDYQAIIQVLFEGSFDFTEPALDALAIGLIQFVIKIVWFVAYFTVILLIYKIITNIIRVIFVKSKERKRHLGGALVGVVNGVMAVFVTMIVLGGGVSFMESASLFLSESSDAAQAVAFEPQRDDILELNRSIIPADRVVQLADDEAMVSDDMIQMIDDMITSYNQNILVSIANNIKVDSSFNEGVKVPFHIDLFDQVLSFEYNDQPIALRQEVSVFSNAYNAIGDDLEAADGDIFSISGTNIRLAFEYLEQSSILPAVMPVAIIYVANDNDVTLSLTDDQIYAIDYSNEVGRLGNVIAGVFDLISGETQTYDTDGERVTIDAQWVRDLFDDVANSEVILLATETFLMPAISDGDSTLSQIVEINDGFSWHDEFISLGNILAEMVDIGMSVSTIQDADIQTLLGAFASVNPDTLLSSDILTEGLINILNGETDIEGLDVLSVPANIDWKGSDTITGELEHILTAIQAIIDDQDTLDLENFDVDLMNSLSNTTIDAILDSYIIRATITDQIATLELGDYSLVVPDEALDLQDYYTKDELLALLSSVKLLYDDLETFDLETLFTMDETDYRTLFESTIIRATITDQLSSFALGDDVLVIPTELYESGATYLTTDALVNILLSIQVISDDLDTFTLDALYGLEPEEYDQLFESKIIRATITSQLETMMLGTDALVLPSGIYESADYLSTQSLTNLMLALNVIKDDIDTFSIDALYSLEASDYDELFESRIIRATITDLLTSYNLGTFALVIPDDAFESTEHIYIQKTELIDLMMAISMFSSNVDTFTLDALYTMNATELNDVFNSMIMQATMSDIILANAMLVQDPNNLSFIVPGIFRESIDVDGVSSKQIVKTELIHIIQSFNALGLSGYDGGISPGLMSTGLDYTTILASGSMHATIDNVIDQNDALDIPDLAMDTLYGFNNVTISEEIIDLINAVDAFDAGDLTSANFTFGSISTLDSNKRSTIVQSMTVRNMITPDVENAAALMLITFNNTDYVNDDPLTFLKVTVVEGFLSTYAGD